MRRVLAAVAVAACALAGLTVPTTPATAGPEADDALRIMLLGDSVTQGSAGDWTWRYRLWQHLTAGGVDFDFVGPRQDLFDNVAQGHGSTAYADPALPERDHAARWGRTVLPDPAAGDPTVAELVGSQPHLVVVMLGLNDLVYGSPARWLPTGSGALSKTGARWRRPPTSCWRRRRRAGGGRFRRSTPGSQATSASWTAGPPRSRWPRSRPATTAGGTAGTPRIRTRAARSRSQPRSPTRCPRSASGPRPRGRS